MGLRPLAALQQLRHRGDPGRRLRPSLQGCARRSEPEATTLTDTEIRAQLRGGTHVGFRPGGSNGNAAGGRGESGAGRRGRRTSEAAAV